MARKCVLCANEYNYCPVCSKDRNKPLWHKLFDSENCRNIFNALNDYNFDLINKEEVKALLEDCDLSVNMKDSYRCEINDIMEKPVESEQVEFEF